MLYADWKNGDITEHEYRRIKLNYTEKAEQLKESILEIEKELQAFSSGVSSKSVYFEQFSKYKNITKITRDILVELIDVILLHENKEITIKFKFSDQFQNILDFIEGNKEKLCI